MAVGTEMKMPSLSKNSGRIITAEIRNTSVLRKENCAETAPLLGAVKNGAPQ